MIKTVFFDLDGTLLSLNVKLFMHEYAHGLAATSAAAGYDGKTTVDGIMQGMEAMLTSDGAQTNEDIFWQAFSNATDIPRNRIEGAFMHFYEERYDEARIAGKPFDGMSAAVKALNRKGYRLFLTTNPLFPRIAIEKRMAWGGIDIRDFEFITTFETMHFCKPDVRYYQEVLTKFHLVPSEVLMIGNHAQEDGVIATLGATCVLTAEELLREDGKKILCPVRTHAQVCKDLEQLPKLN